MVRSEREKESPSVREMQLLNGPDLLPTFLSSTCRFLHPNKPCPGNCSSPWSLFSHSRHSQRPTVGQRENVLRTPTSTGTSTGFLADGLSIRFFFFKDRDHGHILKTFTWLGPRELRQRPMSFTEAQSRLRQLQTNLKKHHLYQVEKTHTNTRVILLTVKGCPFLRPKQKQNRKHDDTEKKHLDAGSDLVIRYIYRNICKHRQQCYQSSMEDVVLVSFLKFF